MKKTVRSVRVGMVRRRSISPKTNQYELASTIGEKLYDEAEHQFKDRPISHHTITTHELQNKQYMHTPGSPKNICLKNITEAYNTNKHYTDDSSLQSHPLSFPTVQQTSNTKLPTIASVSKWSTRKKILVGISTFLLLVAIIVIPIVLGVLLKRSTETTTTTSVTTAATIISVAWLFDNTTEDSNGIYNGQLINGAQYLPMSSTQPYIGYGEALWVTSSSNQSFLISTPFLDLSYKSFTIEAWIYLVGSSAIDRGIFGQCQCSTCVNQCLYLLIRASHLYGGFTMNDLTGSTTLANSTWYHITFVYNYQTKQQILYLNGVQDAIKSNAEPYQGTNGTIQIGSTQTYSITNFFNGYIDNLKLVTRAKSTVEILNDASLIAYYSFDLPNPDSDNGPNGLNGTLNNAIIVTGRINQAMRFTGSISYFRIYGLYQTGYGVYSNKPFSISMWINPLSIIGCTFLQQTTIQAGGTCSYTLGIWSTGTSTGQIVAQGSGAQPMFGSFLTVNSWIHISLTYSSTDGYSLYCNGNLYGSAGSTTNTGSGQLIWLYIGYGGSCFSTTFFSSAAYQGSIDEIYFHNRELTSVEVAALANP